MYTEYVSNRVLHAYVCLEGSQFTVNSLLLVRDKCLTANLHLYERIYKQLNDIYENCPDAANNEIIMSPAHFDNFGYQRALTLTNKYEFTVERLLLQIREGRISSFSSHLHSSCTRERFNINMVRLFSYSNIVHCY